MSPSLEVRTAPLATLDARPLAALWNETYGDDLALSAQAILWCAQPTSRRKSTTLVAIRDGGLAGFLSASTLAESSTGWVEAFVVAGGRGQGRLRSALLQHAEEWLADQGCLTMALGGGTRPLLRGSLPRVSESRALRSAGFVESTLGDVEDMAMDVGRYGPPSSLAQDSGVVRAATPRDREEILALMGEPGLLCAATCMRADAAQMEAVRELCEPGGRLADLMLLWTPHGLRGLCQLVFEDSAQPIEVAYPYRLPRQWAMLRTVVCAQEVAEEGRRLLINAALRRLHNNGVRSCLAPAVAATGDFEEFGFRRYRRWRPMTRLLAARA